MVENVLTQRDEKSIFNARFQLGKELFFQIRLKMAICEVHVPQIINIWALVLIKFQILPGQGLNLLKKAVFDILSIFLQNQIELRIGARSVLCLLLDHWHISTVLHRGQLELLEGPALLVVLYFFKVCDQQLQNSVLNVFLNLSFGLGFDRVCQKLFPV